MTHIKIIPGLLCPACETETMFLRQHNRAVECSTCHETRRIKAHDTADGLRVLVYAARNRIKRVAISARVHPEIAARLEQSANKSQDVELALDRFYGLSIIKV